MKNESAFTPEEVEKGLHLDLIKYLLDYNSKVEDHYNDIHISSDGYCTIVEWECIPYDGSYGGSFQYVKEDQRVMTECILPDNSIVMCYDEEDVANTLKEFLVANPGYYKNEYGMWCKD